MTEPVHLVHLAASLETANRVRQYADQLSTSMADVLEIMVQYYDVHIGIDGEEDESGVSAVRVLGSDAPPGTLHSISGGPVDGVANLIKMFPGEYKAFYRTSRGVDLPVNMKLIAQYRNKQIEALVTEGGILYGETIFPDPSAAAVAVKRTFGLSAASAQTNGWTFWGYMAGPFARSLNDFRANHDQAVERYFSDVTTYANWKPTQGA